MIMNRLSGYSIVLLALVTGSVFLIAALLTGSPATAGGGILTAKVNSGAEKSMVALATDSLADQQKATHVRYGVAGWWPGGRREGVNIIGFPRAPLSFLRAFDPEAIRQAETGDQAHKGSVVSGEKEEASLAFLSSARKAHSGKARKFKKYVERHASRFQIKSNLIFAIIKAESSFNTSAVSSSSAYGLMQLVPETGGRAAYKAVYGEDVIPTRDYLRDPDNNIELGTAYLRHLAQEYFDGVENSDSREYCLIAAYNTGPGNVYRAFGGDYARAMAKINSLSPPEVYDHLTRRLPYAETRNYLAKVVASRREFVNL